MKKNTDIKFKTLYLTIGAVAIILHALTHASFANPSKIPPGNSNSVKNFPVKINKDKSTQLKWNVELKDTTEKKIGSILKSPYTKSSK
jgi:hypothetical protein